MQRTDFENFWPKNA